MIQRLCLCLCALALGSCGMMPWRSPLEVDDPAEVPGAIAAARADFAAGRTADALERARSARKVRGLEASLRDELDLLVESYANRRIEELSAPGSDAGELADLVELDLPQQLSVSAGVRAARLYLDGGRPYRAYRLLKKLESSFPRHHGRAEAGEILVEAGLSLARSGEGWWLWSDRDDGIEVLEFLVLTYPSEPRCDLAFAELARLYEEDRDHELAIQRHEELLFSHLDSPLSVASQARIPHLRLAAIESPEYDRKELLRARAEIESWLRLHAGDEEHDELERGVRLDYADCLQRLVQSDLGIARFYRRISQPFGARFHAARALSIARETSDQVLIARVEGLLRSLPEVAELPGQVRGVDQGAFAHDATDLRPTLETRREAAVEEQEQEPAEVQKP
jgi:hypothetical protein